VLRMARLIDYQLGPGAAATTLLAFTLEKNAQVKIPVGLKVQNVPTQDEKPQKFETLEAISADARLNRLRLVPAPVGVNPLAKGNTGAFLAPGADGLAVAEALAPGDHFILFDEGLNEPIEELEVREIRIEHDQIVLAWTTPIQGAAWDISSPTFKAYKVKRTFRLFGYNAPPIVMVPTSSPNVAGGIKWDMRHTMYAVSLLSDLFLDSRYEEIAVGSRMLMSIDGVQQSLFTVTAVSQDQAILFATEPPATSLDALSATVTKLTASPPFLTAQDRRKVEIYELAGPPIEFWGYEYPPVLASGLLSLAAKLTSKVSKSNAPLPRTPTSRV
jgi:hypothetical protein